MANELLEAYDAKLDRLLTKAEDQVAESTGWLRALRSRGLAAHLENGIPTPKHEEWKYTPLRALTTQQFEPALDAEVAQSDVGCSSAKACGSCWSMAGSNRRFQISRTSTAWPWSH